MQEFNRIQNSDSPPRSNFDNMGRKYFEKMWEEANI